MRLHRDAALHPSPTTLKKKRQTTPINTSCQNSYCQVCFKISRTLSIFNYPIANFYHHENFFKKIIKTFAHYKYLLYLCSEELKNHRLKHLYHYEKSHFPSAISEIAIPHIFLSRHPDFPAPASTIDLPLSSLIPRLSPLPSTSKRTLTSCNFTTCSPARPSASLPGSSSILSFPLTIY